jgi:hypothetical protein
MVNEMLNDVLSLKDEFFDKIKFLTEDELIQIKNSLSQISLAVDKMAAEKKEVYKLINDIRDIIDSHDKTKTTNEVKGK